MIQFLIDVYLEIYGTHILYDYYKVLMHKIIYFKQERNFYDCYEERYLHEI